MAWVVAWAASCSSWDEAVDAQPLTAAAVVAVEEVAAAVAVVEVELWTIAE